LKISFVQCRFGRKIEFAICRNFFDVVVMVVLVMDKDGGKEGAADG